MLTCLRVRNFAIIDALEVELGPGLNVLTGETGAGKSILIDALGLVLGEKARNDLVRTGASQAEVEALFELESPAAVRERLARAGIEDERIDEDRVGGSVLEVEPRGSELVVRRVVSGQGRSRAYVNGRLVTLAQLAELAAGLADISSQHEHHTLVDPRSHLGYLDAFGDLGDRVDAVGVAYAELHAASRALEDARARLRGRADRADFLAFQISEIDAVAPKAGELKTLAADRERLRHAEKLLRAAGGAEEALYGRDGSISEELGKIVSSLRDAAQLDASLAAALSSLEQADTQIVEAARELGHYARNVAMDPERLAEVDERLHALTRLVRKYAPGEDAPEEAINAHRARAAAERASLERAEDEILALESKRDGALRTAAAAARVLSKARAEIARSLSERVTSELRSLGMGAATIVIDVRPLEAGKAGAELAVDGARLSATGIDHVEMLIAPNPGEEPRPLRRIASGGELSRALLAIKRTLAGARRETKDASRSRSLYVFDEVDSGVGGAVAETIGQKLRDVARHDQVLCITHLAPIAIYGEQHFLVKKEIVDGRTRSDIVPLEGAQRVEEIARMLGGITVTKKTRDVAAELLRSARA
ncbi:MAG: DNA repair protein RecN [Deltaproteobacteria bacterium]|nr:DNA repair protein RecN [Deltaproteobacteria bacterium]